MADEEDIPPTRGISPQTITFMPDMGFSPTWSCSTRTEALT